MAKRVLLIALLAAAVLALFISVAALFLASPGAPEAPARYLVRAFAGKTALFREGEELPLAYYDIYPELLPAEDAARLTGGIVSGSKSEAMRVLEDLGA